MQDSMPWYRERWLWLVVGIPLASVILSSIMLYVALTGEDSLVTDDYYKEGIAINQDLDKDRLAASLGLQGRFDIEADGKTFHLDLTGNTSEVSSSVLFLNLEHPTRQSEDLLLRLVPNGNRYIGQLEAVPHGKYYLTLYDLDGAWRLQGVATFPDAVIVMQPKAEFLPSPQ